jgi:hypothetical protein
MRFESGETVVMRGRIGSRIGVVIPATVVRDDPDLTLLYVAPGTPCKRLLPPDGVSLPRVLRPEQLDDPALQLVDSVWSQTHLLHVTRTGREHSIYVRWSEDWVFQGWYANMQTPLVRFDRIGEIEDLYLDIVITPDFSWHWKDEDELAEAVAVGRITAAMGQAVRAEGERVLKEMAATEWPFVPDIATWRPDPAWTIPAMPDADGWDAPILPPPN